MYNRTVLYIVQNWHCPQPDNMAQLQCYKQMGKGDDYLSKLRKKECLELIPPHALVGGFRPKVHGKHFNSSSGQSGQRC